MEIGTFNICGFLKMQYPQKVTGSLQNTIPDITSEHTHFASLQNTLLDIVSTRASLQNTDSSIPSFGNLFARSHSTLPQLLVRVGWGGVVTYSPTRTGWWRPVTPGKGVVTYLRTRTGWQWSFTPGKGGWGRAMWIVQSQLLCNNWNKTTPVEQVLCHNPV